LLDNLTYTADKLMTKLHRYVACCVVFHWYMWNASKRAAVSWAW